MNDARRWLSKKWAFKLVPEVALAFSKRGVGEEGWEPSGSFDLMIESNFFELKCGFCTRKPLSKNLQAEVVLVKHEHLFTEKFAAF